MSSDTHKQYEELLHQHGEDQLLLKAMEESMRLYEEVEIPRRSQVSTSLDIQHGETSNAKENTCREETSVKNSLQNKTIHTSVLLDENGFDKAAGRSWIYPTNYPIRDYQYNIVHSALFKNTLVSLPTGLGKTFIAAVVMYNFYRWYPEGKVLFLAPTRPLVAQQIDSCYRVMGIPKHDTAEMTGHMPPNQREIHWKKCRLFFLTPQSLMSDLMRSTCPVQQIRCIVIDEAHKATGNYSYCQVVQAILPFNCCFRMLALSATPGNDMDAVRQVVKNLLIEHVEVRDELSSDTAQYTNERIVDTIVVKLEGFHKYVQDIYCQVIGSYTDLILKWKLIYGSIRNVSKYSLMMTRNKFRSNPPQGMTQNIAKQIESDFAVCITLAHGLELLCQHGLRNLFRYINSIMEDNDGKNGFCKTRLSNNRRLLELSTILKEKLGETDLKEPDLNTSIGVIQTQSAPSVYSHPKMEKLRDVIINHFQTYELKKEDTRVMVFCQYRDTVVEVCHLLGRLKPLVKAMSFVGQSTGKMNKGFTQKTQLQIMERFRRGGYNTLVSTSIGEEGLDIGEVDLIICYDAHASPIRLVQRMGRTGRKREGRIVMLLTEGKENKKYQQSLANKKSMNLGLVNSKDVLKFSYTSSRMVPEDLDPECYKMFMTMPKISRDRDLKKMFLSKKSNNSKENNSLKSYFNVEDFDVDIPTDVLPETEYFHALDTDKLLDLYSVDSGRIDFSSDLDWIMNDKETINVSRSSTAHDLQELLEFAARRRCDVPLTQTATLASQVCRNDLWPSKKRKKNSLLHTKGPQKKKKNQENSDAETIKKKNKQNRLTSLWSNYSELKENDDELMPPPMVVPHKKKIPTKDTILEKAEEWVESVNENLNNNAYEYTAALESDCSGELPEEDMVNFLSDNLTMTEQMIKRIRELEDGKISCCRFSNMFHASELSSLLLGPVQDRKKDESILQGLTHLPNSGYFEELLNPAFWNKTETKEHTIENFDIGITQLLNISPDLSGEISLKAVNSHMNYESDAPYIILSGGQHCENISKKFSKCHKSFDGQQDEEENNTCNYSKSVSNFPIKRRKVRFLQEEIENTDLIETPHLSQKISQEVPKTDLQVDTEKSESHENLSDFIDEAILKWLESSEDGFDAASSSKDASLEKSSEVPLSPILSSQRKRSIIGLRNASTPKPFKKEFVSKNQKNEEDLNFSNCSEKSTACRYISEELFNDDSSLEDFEIQNPMKPKQSTCNKKEGKSTKEPELLRPGAVFIVNEAEESREDHRDSSDGENTSGLDDLDDSFVNDEEESTAVNESVDIQAHYLQSVRSPLNRQGQFKIKEVQNFQGNIYSQAISEEERGETYEQDSFCVSSNNESIESEVDTLDIIEAVLKKKEKRKPALNTPIHKKKKKRKRIRVVSSSSDDETQLLKDQQNDFEVNSESKCEEEGMCTIWNIVKKHD